MGRRLMDLFMMNDELGEKKGENSEQAGGLTWVIPCEGLRGSSGDSTFKKQLVSC